MNRNSPDLDAISARFEPSGLTIRGTFVFGPGEQAPAGLSGKPAKSLILVGNTGGSIWTAFQVWRVGQGAGVRNPMDTWSRSMIGPVAELFSLRAVYPSEKPWQPFQQWAKRAERLRSSPIGILMHPQYGLWHAYRGALLSENVIAGPDAGKAIHLCDSCDLKPCLNSCPVGAISDAEFAVDQCREHTVGRAGAACRETGCIARNACPHSSHRYSAEQQAFHMAAFLTADPK